MFANVKRNGSTPAKIDTLIGSGLTIEGELAFTGAIRIDGTVRGTISVPVDGEGAIFIGAEGLIEGDIRATQVNIDGSVDGSVFATGTVVIGPSGRISGEVHCGVLEMAPGAAVQGLHAQVRQHKGGTGSATGGHTPGVAEG